MQAGISAVNQELVGTFQSLDKLPQLMSGLHLLLKRQKAGKADVPPGAVSCIANALLASGTDASLALVCVKCLQQVAQLLGHASAAVLRLEGGLQALLHVLQSARMDCTVASTCVHLLAQLAATSNVTLTTLTDGGVLPTLVRLLGLHGAHEPFASAVLELLVLASKTPKAAIKLAQQQGLVQILENVFEAHVPSSSTCSAVLKCIRRLAKQPSCRCFLAAAVPVLLRAAQHMASVPGQHRQRACRAIWLLKGSSCLPAIPPKEPTWPTPSRTAPHLNLASAMGRDVERLQQLFPELQAAWSGSQATHAATEAAANATADRPGYTGNQTGASGHTAATEANFKASDHAANGLWVSGKGVLPSTAVAGGGLAAVRGLTSKTGAASEDDACTAPAAGEDGALHDNLPKLGWELPLGPPSVAELTDLAKQQMSDCVVSAEDFNAGGEQLTVQNMLHDLTRLQGSRQLKNAVVYDSMQLPAACLANGVTQHCMCSSSSSSSSDTSDGSSGQLQHAGTFLEYMAHGTSAACNNDRPANCHSYDSSSSSDFAGLTFDSTSTTGSSNSQPAAAAGVLHFDSRFESGNLRMAVHVQDYEYDLFMSNDLNDRSSNSSTQWFYFAVWNALPGVTYKLNLVNFSKPKSLYASCKRPLMCCSTTLDRSVQSDAGSAAAPARRKSAATAPSLYGGLSENSAGAPGAVCCGADKSTATQHVGSPSRGWFRAGHSISYYPSAYRGRPPAAAACRSSGGSSNRNTAVDKGSCSSITGSADNGSLNGSSRSASPSRRHKAAALPKKAAHRKAPNAAPNSVHQGSHSQNISSRTNSTRRQTFESAATAAAATGNHSHSSRRSTVDALGAGSTLGSCSQRTRRHTDTPAAATEFSAPGTTTASHSSSGELLLASSSPEVANGRSFIAAAGSAEGPAGPGLYCLTFSLEFPCSGMYLICSCLPYSYSELQQQLAALLLRCNLRLLPGQASPVVRSLLCYSLAGQRCDMLTISDFSAGTAELAVREYVVITARVHPGETCASWITQGAIEFLVSDAPLAQRLRRYFVFKIIPMLNPDGVVVGNYRASLAGVDLNRQWDKAVQPLHPTIFHARKLLEALVEAGRLALTIDIHGHRSALDAFFYGCEPVLPKLTAAERKEMRAGAAAAVAVPASSLVAAATVAPAAAQNVSCCTDADVQAMPVVGEMNSTDMSNSIKQAVQSSCTSSPSRCSSSCSSKSVTCTPPAAHVCLDSGNSSVCSTLHTAVTGCAVSRQDSYVHSASPSGAHDGAIEAQAIHSTHTDAGEGVQAAAVAQQQPELPQSAAAATIASLSAASIARMRVRMLPYLASQQHPGFSFSQSHFKTQKNKAGTARVVAARQLGVPGAYTLEASLAGCSATQCHFTVKDYLELGESLMAAVGQLAESDDQRLLGQVASTIKLAPLPGHPGFGNAL